MNFIITLLIGFVIDCYYYPFSFTFLPHFLNTKMMLAFVGSGIFLFNCLKAKSIKLSIQLVSAMALAALFSGLCLLSCEINNTFDYSYVSYIVSFFTWLMGAYAVCEVIRRLIDKISLEVIVRNLAFISAFHCFLALIIDASPLVQDITDAIFYTYREGLNSIDRLYSIGVALDPAGVRFSVVAVLIVHVLLNVKLSKKVIYFYLICYFSILVIGNMISRTTTIGILLSIFYFLFKTMFTYKKDLEGYSRIYYPSILMIVLSIAVSIYFYNISDTFRGDMRFAFEGFFNWYETGVWRTDSTDKLNNVMWVWPNTTKEWIWGTGIFGSYAFSTDIGYCRFILYCGLVGFGTFCLFFIYNAWAIWNLRKANFILSLILLSLTFVIWIKVATDIFFIYAIFYCLDSDIPDEKVELKKESISS